MSDAEIECRPAHPADWPEIWPIVHSILAAGDTYMYPPGLSEHDARTMWMLPGVERAGTYVATIGGDVVATAYLKPNQPGQGDHVANAGWMVAPSAAGRGVGRRLAVHVIDAARQIGFRAMQFNAVVATNTGAVTLWKSLGFDIVGTVPDAFRHPTDGLCAVHIMYRAL